jgi:hypothetical protein
MITAAFPFMHIYWASIDNFEKLIENLTAVLNKYPDPNYHEPFIVNENGTWKDLTKEHHIAQAAMLKRDISDAVTRLFLKQCKGCEPPPNEPLHFEVSYLLDVRNWAVRAMHLVAQLKDREKIGIPPESGAAKTLKEKVGHPRGSVDQAVDQYVTLDKVAAFVNRGKRTLERWIEKDQKAPLPDVQGGGGKSNEWKWSTIKSWLENKVGRKLPDKFPTLW